MPKGRRHPFVSSPPTRIVARRGGAPGRALAAVALAFLLAGCGNDDAPTTPGPNARTYSMGFSAFPPRFSKVADILQTIDAWAPRADAALIVTEPPWDSLLAGRPPDSLIRNNQLGLAAYYRSKGLRVIVSIDPTNGLDRSSNSLPLLLAGRSLAEPQIQGYFRAYAVAMDTLLRPDCISVASETNLIRAIAPAALYTAVVQTASGAAADIRARDAVVKIFTTVQVEAAWGTLGGPGGSYVGVAQDRADFPFIQTLGLSSYPYLGGFAHPDSIPLDYYSRLVEGDPLPEMVIEGGWSSDSTSNPTSWTRTLQRRYIERHAQILDRASALGWFQITFTDLDLASLGLPPSAEPFAHLGLVDVNFAPKAALSAWDAAFVRPKR